MATVESPDSAKTENSSLDQLDPMDTPASENTESFVQKDESSEDERTDCTKFVPKSSTIAVTSVVSAADSAAVTAQSEDNVQPRAEADSTTGNLPENHKPGTETGPSELQSLIWSESEDYTDEAREENLSPKHDLSSITESVGEGNCSIKMTTAVSETEITQPENSEEKRSKEKQKGEADGKEEEADPEEDVEPATKQIKRRMMCKECGKIFNRRETFNLHRHFHLHEDELKPLTCKECGLTFQQRSSFIKHRNEHKEKETKLLTLKRGGTRKDQKNFQCAECAIVFITVDKLRNHKCGFSDDVLFHCPICRQEFKHKPSITRHMLSHSQEKFQCSECDQTFPNPAALGAHQNSHRVFKPYECSDCGSVFKDYSLMAEHRRKHTDNLSLYPCKVCGKSFKCSSLLHQHQYLHTGQKPFHCSECGKTYAFAQNLKAHCRQHSLGIIPATPKKPKNNLFISGQNTVKRSEKENVLQNKDVPPNYKCPLCNQNYTTPANLRTHMHTHEAEYEMMDRTSKEPLKLEKEHTCPHCPKVYCDELSLNVHVSSVHTSDSTNNIPVLPSKTIPSQINDSMQENVGVRSFKCPEAECGKSFRHRSVLELHMRIHSKDKPYQCKVCGKSFRFSSYLQQHLIIHTGKRPYKCPDCGRAFAFLQNMKTHQKLHQEKPFRCSSCHKGYSDETQLKHHMLSHKGDKPHRCNICDKTFGLAYQLLDHMNTHTGARPHRCEVCNRSFTWLSSLLVHRKTHKRQGQNNSLQVGERMREGANNSVRGAWGLSFSGSGMVGPSNIPVGDDDQPPPMSTAGMEQKPRQMNESMLPELPPPVQWKADGGEVLPAPSVQQTYVASQAMSFDNPSQSRSMSGQTKEPSHLIENSPSYVGSGPSCVPQKSSPSSAAEIEQHRQLKAAVWSSPSTSTVASTSALHSEFTQTISYINGAALWSVRPAAPNLNSHNSPKKLGQEVQLHTWPGAPIPAQTNLSSPLKKEELRTWDMGNPEKQWVSGLSTASSLAQITPHGLGARWDIQTSPGMQKTLKSPDHLVSNPDFQLQQKQMSPSWAAVQSQTTTQNVPISIQYEPHRFAQTINAPMWSFQTNPVTAQTMLKPGNVQELQQQQTLAAGTKIIINQPPPFFPPLPTLTAMGLPPSHPLHSVSVGALPRPPHPNLFFPPQVSQALSLPQLPPQREPHKLGPRLSFAPDRLHQCMICGCTLPREVDLQMHYMQHAQGEI